MKFRSAVHRSTVIIVILIASVFLGYGYQVLGEYMDRKQNPREYAEFVSRYAEEYGIPDYMVYAVISVESGFRSGAVSDDGRIGLMQVNPENLEWLVSSMREPLEQRALHDPETNIRVGCYYLAYLYSLYGRWTPTLAAYETTPDDVTFWSLEDALTDKAGNLIRTPYESVNGKITAIEEKAEVYRALYH